MEEKPVPDLRGSKDKNVRSPRRGDYDSLEPDRKESKKLKAAKRQEKRRAKRLEKCRKKIDIMSKNSNGPRDLVDKYCAVHKKYEEEIYIVLNEDNPIESLDSKSKEEYLPQVKEADPETGLPKVEYGKSWKNFLGDTQKPQAIWHPTNLAQLVSVVIEAEKQKLKVRAVGPGYSFNNITHTRDWLVNTNGLKMVPTGGELFLSNQEKEIIKEAQLSTGTLFQVEAGVTLEVLSNALLEVGLALPNLTSHHEISIAGAISTASHGTGRYLGCISDYVESIDIVVTGGKIYRVEPTMGISDPGKFEKKIPGYSGLIQEDKFFNSLVVSMGSMGIIFSVILRVEKKYWLKETGTLGNWMKISKQLQKGKLWNPKKPKNRSHLLVSPYGAHTALLVTTKYIGKDPGSFSSEKRRTFSNSLAPKLPNAAELTSNIFRFFPKHTPELLDLVLKGMGEKVYTDLGPKLLNHSPTNELTKKSYSIGIIFPIDPIDLLISQIERAFAVVELQKREMSFVTFPFLLRFVNKSQAYMAPSINGPICVLEISCLADVRNSISTLKRLEEELVKNGGIPHWGLRFNPIKKDKLQEHFPQFDEWSKVFTTFNSPHYTFSNSFTDELFLDPQRGVPPCTLDTVGPFKVEAKEHKVRGLVRFNPQDLQREFPHIAKGSYGVVFKGRAPDIPNTVAIKDMDIVNPSVIEDWKKELTVMSQNQSPHVVEVYGYTNDSTIVTIVMEFMSRGDLFSILHKKMHPLSTLQRLRMARHCSLGLSLLHQHQVIHRDVKSLNILVTEDYSCKLTDFGCAKLVSDRQIFNTANSGTPLWMAPEVKKGQYSFSADIFSLGLVVYELFEQKLPGWDDIQKVIVLPNQFQSYSLVIPCIYSIPEKRPTAIQIVKALDNMIISMVESVKASLPNIDQELFLQAAAPEGDVIENKLVQLYKYLLTRTPEEADALINRAYVHQFPNGNQSTQTRPQQITKIQ